MPHGLIDDGFDAAPFRLHVVSRDASGCGGLSALIREHHCAYAVATPVRRSDVRLYPSRNSMPRPLMAQLNAYPRAGEGEQKEGVER